MLAASFVGAFLPRRVFFFEAITSEYVLATAVYFLAALGNGDAVSRSILSRWRNPARGGPCDDTGVRRSCAACGSCVGVGGAASLSLSRAPCVPAVAVGRRRSVHARASPRRGYPLLIYPLG